MRKAVNAVTFPPDGAGQRRAGLVSLACGGAIFTITLLFILLKNKGVFLFSLDDPYIHLALAQRLLHGSYGLNPGEPASPASSIIYPFLLVPLLALGFGQWAALLLNGVGGAASLMLIPALAAEAGIDLMRAGLLRLCCAAVVIVLGLNLAGLALTGLEHSLHVADTLACLLGVARMLRTGRIPFWLPIVLVGNPLIRFEGLSVWLSGIVILALEAKRFAAAATFVAGLLLVGGFCLFLHARGLPFLPSSVLVKSAVAGSAGGSHHLLAGLRMTLLGNLARWGAVSLLIASALLVYGARTRFARRIAVFACVPVVAHLLAGAFGWFGRYEIYILALSWASVMLVYPTFITSSLVSPGPTFILTLAVWLALHLPYLRVTTATPAASHEIYLQQFQMQRFERLFWRAPIAVNDLGLASFGNTHYVLDLAGLGSETARLAHLQAGGDPAWMAALASRHQVGLAMIYADWFAAVPHGWTAMATLTLEHPNIVAGGRTVTFFATDPAVMLRPEAALLAFAPTLPPGVVLDVLR